MMLVAAIFVCNGLFIFTDKVGKITNEHSPRIKLIMSTQWLKETKILIQPSRHRFSFISDV